MNQILKYSVDEQDYVECIFCKEKLYKKTIECKLQGETRKIKLNYERCNCDKAQKYWKEYELEKAIANERANRLELMQEFTKKVKKIIKNSNMSKRNLDYKFENFSVNINNRNVFESIKKYTERLVEKAENKGLIIVGDNGVGKTHLACSIGNALIKNGIPIIYGTLINLLAEVRNSYGIDTNISEMDIIKLYECVDMLIIDDLGKEKPSEWGLEKLFTIINSRYENNLPVIITTNYNQNILMKRLSLSGENETAKSIISRLYAMCYLVKIDDVDHRINKKMIENLSNQQCGLAYKNVSNCCNNY